MNKKLKNLLMVTGAATLTAAAVYGLNKLDAKKDKKRYPQMGRMVEVRGKRMHVYTCGEGENTIVMLTGHSTPTPSIDFRPLVSRLGASYKVVVPEPFGYGYSEHTSEPRTVENVVDEIREGLRKAGMFPPYVLCGHSLGGINMLYWAAHYPREVAGVIGIDSTLPQQANMPLPMPKPIMKAMTFLSNITPIRLIIKAGMLDSKLNAFAGGDKDLLPVLRSHMANSQMSSTSNNELFAFSSNCAEVAGLNYPASCPVLMFVASESQELVQNSSTYSFDWMAEHEKLAMHAFRGKCMMIEGGHFLHHTAAEEMANEIRAFFPAEEELLSAAAMASHKNH